jgi:hypothetical protein
MHSTASQPWEISNTPTAAGAKRRRRNWFPLSLSLSQLSLSLSFSLSLSIFVPARDICNESCCASCMRSPVAVVAVGGNIAKPQANIEDDRALDLNWAASRRQFQLRECDSLNSDTRQLFSKQFP